MFKQTYEYSFREVWGISFSRMIRKVNTPLTTNVINVKGSVIAHTQCGSLSMTFMKLFVLQKRVYCAFRLNSECYMTPMYFTTNVRNVPSSL